MSQEDDYSSGFDAGLKGGMGGANSASGLSGYLAGQQAASQRSVGSIEWLIAPFVLAPVFAWLYPLTTAVTLSVAYGMEAVATAFGLPPSGGMAILILAAPTAFVLWTFGRIDQNWGQQSRQYRRWRHVARLIIVALVVNAAAFNAVDSRGRKASRTSSPRCSANI